VIQAAESRIKEVRPQILADAVRFSERAGEQDEGSVQKRTPEQGWSGSAQLKRGKDAPKT